MDRLTKDEIEGALHELLPGCTVECTFSPDGTTSLLIGGEDGDSFAVVGLVRSQYRGEAGLKRLARYIAEDIGLARQRLRTRRVQKVSSDAPQVNAPALSNKTRH